MFLISKITRGLFIGTWEVRKVTVTGEAGWSKQKQNETVYCPGKKKRDKKKRDSQKNGTERDGTRDGTGRDTGQNGAKRIVKQDKTSKNTSENFVEQTEEIGTERDGAERDGTVKKNGTVDCPALSHWSCDVHPPPKFETPP